MNISNHKEKIVEQEASFSFNQREPFDDHLVHFSSQQKHISLNGVGIEILHRPDWCFTNNNETFSFRLFLIGENVLLARMKGKMTSADANATYQLIGKVTAETQLTSYYYIEDLRKLQPVSRQTRRVIKKLDSTLEPPRIQTHLILPQIGRTMYSMFNSAYRKNVNSSPSIKEAILACTGIPSIETVDKNSVGVSKVNSTDLYSASKEDLVEMITQLKEENATLKAYQQHRISYLVGMIGQILWSDGFDFQKLKLSPEDDYYELYEAFSILIEDFQHLQAKKNITRSHARYLSHLLPALDHTPTMLLTVDPQLRILNCNASFKKHIKTQFDKDIDAGQHLLQAFPENILTKWKNLLENVYAGQAVHIPDDGYFGNERSTFSIAANPVFNKKNEVISIAVVISTSAHQEVYLYEQFRTLSEHIGDLVCLLTPNGLMAYVTSSVALILGYPQEELIGRSIFRYIHPEDTSQFLSSGHTNFFLRNHERVEFRLLKRDQSYEWFEAVSTAVKSKDGKEEYIVVAAREHNETKHLSVKLSIREEELKSTLEGMSESVYVFDKNGILITTNQQKNKDYFIESSCDALIGKAYQEIFADTFIQKLDKAIRVTCTTQVKHEFEYMVKREGEEKAPDYYKICVLARKDIAGNFAGITMITRNVTASRRLKEQNAALEKANEELDHFVYSASHDLRAPLASTMGLINITRISDNLQEKANYLNLMESSLQKMDRYIHDITDYSRNARLAIELEKIEFNELINDIIQTLSYHENTSKIDFLIKTEDTIPFYSDYSRLSIIFRNIISNAVKYHDLTRPHLYLSIDIKITQHEGIFHFEDNGIGIEEKYIDKIFDMFYQASPESFGSGLGLYIVKEAMNKLKGSIRVESTPGQGSVFTVTLPNHTEKRF